MSLIAAGATSSFAQTIPNANFDSWTTVGTSESPDGWLTLNGKTFIQKIFGPGGPITLPDTTVVKATASVDIKGVNTPAIKTVSVSGQALPGVLASCDSVFVDTVKSISSRPKANFFGGIPVSSRPASLNGIRKYIAKGGKDSAAVSVLFTKYNGSSTDTVGAGNVLIDSLSGVNWATFTCPITWQDPQGNPTTATPDTAIIILTSSSSPTNAKIGSTFYVDSLEFVAPVELSCTPDPSISTSGTTAQILPDTNQVIMATAGASFSQTFTIYAPVNLEQVFMGIAVKATIDSIKITEPSGLPTGLTYTCGTPDCIIAGGEVGCFTISGTMPADDDIDYSIGIKFSPYGALSDSLVTPFGTMPAGTDIQSGILATALAAAPAAATYTVSVPVGLEDFSANGSFTLEGNYPNPFDGSTTISFNTTFTGSVDFTVVDVLGREVYDANIEATAGENTFVFTTDLANGTYFFSISDGTNTITKKMVVSGSN